MRVKFVIICLLMIVLLFMPLATMAQSDTGAPVVSPGDAEADPGDEFELKVSVTANVNGTYRVTFNERSRFTFPGERYAEHNLTNGDAILFKVACKVDDDTPDGDFDITFKVTWEYNGTPQEQTGSVRVTVGEGADPDSGPCGSASMVLVASVFAGSMIFISKRKRRR